MNIINEFFVSFILIKLYFKFKVCRKIKFPLLWKFYFSKWKFYFSADKKTIERLLKIQWWRYHFADFYDIDLNLKINQYLDLLEEKIIKKSISYYNPNKLYFRDILELKSKNLIYFNLFFTPTSSLFKTSNNF